MTSVVSGQVSGVSDQASAVSGQGTGDRGQRSAISHPPSAISDQRSAIIVIVGPTAAGKTALSLTLAEALAGEIVSADSRQIYRGMDIGTAKASLDEQARVPHHLLDVVDPDQVLTLAEYQRMAYFTIDAILARGRLPFLVGGTGQYVQAVIEGWRIPEVPPNAEVRAGWRPRSQPTALRPCTPAWCTWIPSPQAASTIATSAA